MVTQQVWKSVMPWFTAVYPATSDARGTSVGTLAIERYLRPVCYQNYPDHLLPLALQNANTLGIARLVNGEMSKAAL